MSYVTSIGTTTGDLEGDLVCPSAIAELLVRIFYARQFSAFISLLSPANETRYVQSHLSCVCLSVCLSSSGSNSWTPSSTSLISDTPIGFRNIVSRSRGQGQGHTSVTKHTHADGVFETWSRPIDIFASPYRITLYRKSGCFWTCKLKNADNWPQTLSILTFWRCAAWVMQFGEFCINLFRCYK